jgi:hypothetical protein
MADPTAHKRSPTSESATDLDANDEDKAVPPPKPKPPAPTRCDVNGAR